MGAAIEDNSITLMSLVTTFQLGRTLSRRTCSEIGLALLLLCSIMFFYEVERREAAAGTSLSKILVSSRFSHTHECAPLKEK
jgi:hypothetical protein